MRSGSCVASARGLAAIDSSNWQRMRRGWVRAHNLDAAVLYLGRLLSESRTTFDPRLPGAASDWRDAPLSAPAACSRSIGR